MSFSADVKEELVKIDNDARHCQIAELAAILVYSGVLNGENHSKKSIVSRLDSPHASSRCLGLISRLQKRSPMQRIEDMDVSMEVSKEQILRIIKYTAGSMLVNPLLLKSQCCKRAFLRGAFLETGSMSNPKKGYHLEFVCSDLSQAEQITEVMLNYDIRAKIVPRKKYKVVYLKESEEIVELLNVMGAHVSLMNLENLRILKDMRNSINRRVNCEAANITKTVNAAAKQIADIQYLQKHYGFDQLAPGLRQMAELRIEYPDATLKELGQYLVPCMGKSGVNHRLRKLSELAERLKNQHGGK